MIFCIIEYIDCNDGVSYFVGTEWWSQAWMCIVTRIQCKNPTNWPNLMFRIWMERRESDDFNDGNTSNFEQIHGKLEAKWTSIQVRMI